MFDDTADTIDEWVALAQRNCASALALLNAKQTVDAWNHAGFAVECTVKAAIMKHKRFNRWPPKSSHPNLYVHNLKSLVSETGIVLNSLNRDPIASRLATVLQWGRNHSYYPKSMPVSVASDIYQAACGPDGVNSWLRSRFRLGT